jgi:uncharacterized membrane protein SpoIIM required for sporulation
MALTSAVRETAFVGSRERDWDDLKRLTFQASRRGIRALSPEERARIPALYRDVCADLARAEGSRYSAPLVEYLQGLTAAAHTVFYAPEARSRRSATRARRIAGGLVRAFPRAVRKHRWAMLLSFVLFFGPFFAGLWGSLLDPQFAFRIVPEATLRPLTEAYARGFDEGRATGEAAMMTGFYVNNNVGIALRCFALGIFGGIGSAFYLVENGLSIGAILGYVASQGAGANILTFIVGHGSLELGAIVIAGGAGLAMGWSVIAPGERTRLASLQHASRDIVVIVFGAAVMLLLAALVEGFWSGSSVPRGVKIGVGATLFLLVVLYLALVGRDGDGKDDARDRTDRDTAAPGQGNP